MASCVRPTVSRSNTGLASGWSPCLGSSPLSISMLRMPSAAAAIRSLCSAMRLRSRQVNWRIGSMPFCSSRPAAVTAPRCARAPAPSVTLTASARPLSGIALASRSAASNEAGGVISAVMTKRPAASLSLRVSGEFATRVCSPIPAPIQGVGCGIAAHLAQPVPPIGSDRIDSCRSSSARSTRRSPPSPMAACWRSRAKAPASPWRRPAR